MEYCKRCLYPTNHPLYITMDQEGVCSGCRVHEEKERLDWIGREQKLIRLLEHFKDRRGAYYDCIIPVNGDGDSFFVVDQLKNKYGMNPLLITYNIHYNTKLGIRNLARLITKLDCDHVMFTVSPTTLKKVVRRTLEKIGDMYWHVAAGVQAFAVTISKRFNIPLIVWGVNGWLDQVGQFSHEDSVEMTKKVWQEHGLRNLSPMDLVNEEMNLTAQMMRAFMYPEDDELEQSRTRGIFLGNFIYWDAQKQIEGMIEKYGYETTKEERTFNRYETIGCHHNSGVHDYLKFLKHGYGKVTDHASRDIRLGRLTREQGIDLVEKYQSVKPSDMPLFLEWIGMSEPEFMEIVDRHRDPEVWERDALQKWVLKDSVSHHRNDEGVEAARLKKPLKPREYMQTPLMEHPTADKDYVLMGRGYIDEKNYKAIEF